MSTLQIEREIRKANVAVKYLPADRIITREEIDLMIDTAVIDVAVIVEAKAHHQVVMDLHHVEEITLLPVAVEADHRHVVDPLLPEIEVLLEGIPLLHHHHQGTTEEDIVVVVLLLHLHHH